MSNNTFNKMQCKFQFLYLLFMCGIFLFGFLTVEKGLLGNYLIYFALFLIGGFRFNSFENSKLNLLTRPFKINFFNCINWCLQWFVVWQLFFTVFNEQNLNRIRSIVVYSVDILMSTFHTNNTNKIGTLNLINTNNAFSTIGYLTIFACTLLFAVALIFSITLPKTTGLFQVLIITIGITLFYITIGATFFDSMLSVFGETPHFLGNEPFLSIFFFVIPMVYVSLEVTNLPMPKLWSFITSQWKYYLYSIFFFCFIFLIDSAVWLHPFSSWKSPNLDMIIFSIRSGFGEEFIFRILILTVAIAGLKKYKHSISLAIIIQASVFGLMHISNIMSGAPLITTIASTIDAFGIGVLFAVIYISTKNLSFIIIIHTIWDLLQSIVTGSGNMSVSGAGGFIISITVAILCLLYSYYLFKKNHHYFLNAMYLN